MRSQGRNPVEVTAPKQSLDLLQLESQLPVEQDLLQRQQLRLIVEAISVGCARRGLQQANFIVKMKRPHANTRHPGHFFDCISHSGFSIDITMMPIAAHTVRANVALGSKNVFKNLSPERLAAGKG